MLAQRHTGYRLRFGISVQVSWDGGSLGRIYCSIALSLVRCQNLELRNARARYFADGYANQCGHLDLLHSRGNRAVVSLIRGEGTRPGNRFIWEVERAEQLVGYLDDQNLESLRGYFVDVEVFRGLGSPRLSRFSRCARGDHESV